MVCPHGQGESGVAPVGHFADEEGGGQFFSIMCGRLLWTAPCKETGCNRIILLWDLGMSSRASNKINHVVP